MNEENVGAIYEVLKGVYDDCAIDDYELQYLAEELYENFFEGDRPLNEILFAVYRFEEEMRDDGIEIDVGRQCAVFDKLVDFLEPNKKNARRLYESFTGYCDIKTFDLLMNDFKEWLTKKARAEVLEIGKKSFLEPIWKQYV